MSRKMGAGYAAVGDAVRSEMVDTLKALIEMSAVPADAWRDLLLLYAVTEAHDQGVDRADFERTVAASIDALWSTPNKTGQVTARNRRRN